MDTLRFTLRPEAAFGGPMRGDTLFGQLCWAARNRWGATRLDDLLDGYTGGRPFVACSDAFPSGHLPRPALPLHRFQPLSDADRKAVKRRRWIPLEYLDRPVEDWLQGARDDADVVRHLMGGGSGSDLARIRPQAHNSIDRRSGTTGSGAFAPYTQPQHWYAPGTRLDVYLTIEGDRIDPDDVAILLRDIGRSGYGRDASIGLGKFSLLDVVPAAFASAPDTNACLTLAPCAPQGLELDSRRSYYEPFTRFGRHGDLGVYGTGGPFKTPVLLAGTGALFAQTGLGFTNFIGQGLGGDGRVSKSIPETVQQGYAPCAAVRVHWEGA